MEAKSAGWTSDLGGVALLLWAAEHGDESSASLALEKGADANTGDWLRQTPLSVAAKNGHVETVKLLSDTSGAAVNTTDWRDRTSLAWAAGKEHTSVVRMLMDRGDMSLSSQEKSG
ncbi:ankyrin [Didymella exigua CBS 183.55]|uniref:Ankyrin n=1 Tax=Didymella exigua CBS 183.55 TaxID=1150837 RepID=A0A6A5RYC1_9PLEO|nr:ankyrin [Didymella exigua CBS 183.55]KAF1930257.1 ankyrin [Didymella exigua CBS 183.55]